MSSQNLRLLLIILAGCGACSLRVDSKNLAAQVLSQRGSARTISNSEAPVESVVSVKQASEAKLNVEGILSAVAGLANSLIAAFSEDPPDFEYGFLSLELQGWKLIKLLVPHEHQKSREFKRASRAWKAAFANAGEIVEGLYVASKKGDTKAIIEALMGFVGTAFKTIAAYDSKDSDLLLAINDLVQKMAHSSLMFCTSMGWLGLDVSSLALQVQGITADFAVKAALLLTTGVELLRNLITAFAEKPPDFELAFESVALQGWKIVEVLVPSERQRTDEFKKAHEAWQAVFADAAGVADGIMQGTVASVARAILQTVDTALKAAGHLVDPSLQKLLDSIRTLLVGVGEAWLEFSHRLGWTA